jgi:hypothetical protein
LVLVKQVGESGGPLFLQHWAGSIQAHTGSSGQILLGLLKPSFRHARLRRITSTEQPGESVLGSLPRVRGCCGHNCPPGE